jgi:hypothetical protein
MNLASAELKAVNCKSVASYSQNPSDIPQPANLTFNTPHRNAQPQSLKISAPTMYRTPRATKPHLHNMTRRRPEHQRLPNLTTR